MLSTFGFEKLHTNGLSQVVLIIYNYVIRFFLSVFFDQDDLAMLLANFYKVSEKTKHGHVKSYQLMDKEPKTDKNCNSICNLQRSKTQT